MSRIYWNKNIYPKFFITLLILSCSIITGCSSRVPKNSVPMCSTPISKLVVPLEISLISKYLGNGGFYVSIKTNLINSLIRFKIYSESVQSIQAQNVNGWEDDEKIYSYVLSSEDKNYVIDNDSWAPPHSENFSQLGQGFNKIATNNSGYGETIFYLYNKESLKHNFSEIEQLTYYSDNDSILGQVLNQRKILETDGKIIISFIITPNELGNMELPEFCKQYKGSISDWDGYFDCRITVPINSNKKNNSYFK